ncbi:hypothetical protein WG922_08335 [Ramlibacter sp. AN1015]|uniref:hypothetical protein n=1 Tax=Ramlibacter sp. AN1015 TaxID=3133428 RepID=UPI0030BB7BD1
MIGPAHHPAASRTPQPSSTPFLSSAHGRQAFYLSPSAHGQVMVMKPYAAPSRWTSFKAWFAKMPVVGRFEFARAARHAMPLAGKEVLIGLSAYLKAQRIEPSPEELAVIAGASSADAVRACRSLFARHPRTVPASVNAQRQFERAAADETRRRREAVQRRALERAPSWQRPLPASGVALRASLASTLAEPQFGLPPNDSRLQTLRLMQTHGTSRDKIIDRAAQIYQGWQPQATGLRQQAPVMRAAIACALTEAMQARDGQVRTVVPTQQPFPDLPAEPAESGPSGLQLQLQPAPASTLRSRRAQLHASLAAANAQRAAARAASR